MHNTILVKFVGHASMTACTYVVDVVWEIIASNEGFCAT